MKCTNAILKRLIIVIMLAVATVCGVRAGEPTAWEHTPGTGVESSGTESIGTGNTRIDIAAREGFIYINLQRRAVVRVFTILGQTVSQQTLQPGTSRLRVPTRGIYIVRVDNVTRRVTV